VRQSFIQKHEYFGDYLDFIVLFICILSLYVINLGVVSFLKDSPYTFLTMLNMLMLMYLMYYVNLNETNIVLFLAKTIE